MSGECDKCNEHCLDCQCCAPPDEPPTFKILADPGYETYARPDGHIGIRPSPTEQIDHPSHYQGNALEVIDIIEDFDLNFCLGNAIKYILRAGKKGNKLDDLNKAIWYLERECQKIGEEMLFNEQK